MEQLRTIADASESYEILRALASPLVAITTRSGDHVNGMIANSAVRASLIPGSQRVSNYVFKRHLTHRYLVETGVYVLHLLSPDQWDEIWSLGFRSGRDNDKLAGLEYALTPDSGLPVLTRSWAWMECEVANTMDAGPATFFLGSIGRMGRGAGKAVMDSRYFREHMPDDWRPIYRAQLEEAQRRALDHADLDDAPWRRLQEQASGSTS